MKDKKNELKLALTMDRRPIIYQWTYSILDAVKDDLVCDSREEVKAVLLEFEKNVKRVCSAELATAKINHRSELLLELLQVFNDYDVPLTMTAEQVRDILVEYLAKKD